MNDTINQVGAGAPAAWTKAKPTAPGAYWIRGEGEGMLARTALVEVVNFEGELWCNLHMRNTDPEFGYGYTVAQLDEAFEWLGPLSPAAPVVQAEQQPVAEVDHECDNTIHWLADLEQIATGTRLYAAPPTHPDAVLVEALRNLLSDDDIRRLRRFQEICEDSDADGHDLPKEAVRRLERAGTLRSCGFGRHETTLFGDAILAALAGKGGE